MDPDDGLEDEGPFSAWLPPDDRLWRHPSEIGGSLPHGFDLTQDFDALTGLGGDATHDFDAHLGAASRGMGTLLHTRQARTWTVAVVAGVVGALLASGVSMATGSFGHRAAVLQTASSVVTPDTVALSIPRAAAATSGLANWSSVANVMAASVVGVLASDGASGSGVLYASGSGRSFVLTTGDLATDHAEVTFDDGERKAARLVGTDPASELAVLSVPGMQRAFPRFGSVSDLRQAEPVLAVSGSQSEGAQDMPLSVTAVDQAATVSDDRILVGMLAVTGSSPTREGGALVDADGRVVGITTSLTSTSPMQQGTSYAIPVNLAVHVANQMLRKQTVTHPYVGVLQAQDLSSVTAQGFGISGGATVETVAPGSPAAAAGLAPGDVITAMGSLRVTSAGGLLSALCDHRPGTSTTIRYLHKGKPATVTVRVSEQPESIDDPDSY